MLGPTIRTKNTAVTENSTGIGSAFYRTPGALIVRTRSGKRLLMYRGRFRAHISASLGARWSGSSGTTPEFTTSKGCCVYCRRARAPTSLPAARGSDLSASAYRRKLRSDSFGRGHSYLSSLAEHNPLLAAAPKSSRQPQDLLRIPRVSPEVNLLHNGSGADATLLLVANEGIALDGGPMFDRVEADGLGEQVFESQKRERDCAGDWSSLDRKSSLT